MWLQILCIKLYICDVKTDCEDNNQIANCAHSSEFRSGNFTSIRLYNDFQCLWVYNDIDTDLNVNVFNINDITLRKAQ